MKSNQIINSENKVRRHSNFTILLHWLLVFTVLNGLITLINTKSNIILTVHIIGGGIMGLVLVAHFIYYYSIRRGSPIFPRKGDIKATIVLLKATFSGSKEPPNDKYLPEQRLAYLYILICVILVVVTGVGRAVGGEHRHTALQNLSLTQIIGIFHGPAVFLLIVGIAFHLSAFLIKNNRPLLTSMFKGTVDIEYVKKRHEIWYAHMKNKV
jgi:cytochrome b subunit of formate dehydrogenase